MDRCGVAVVEFLECPDRSARTRVELVRKFKRLGFNFSDQALDKAPQIDPIATTLIEGSRACSEIDRHRDRHRTNYRRMRASFTEILQGQVSPEAESNQRDARIFRGRKPNHRPQIASLAAVIKPW